MLTDNELEILEALIMQGWFDLPGAYVMVDGQYGSTGKGVLACMFGKMFGPVIDVVTTNAGPNSGHTAIHRGEKIVTKQFPIAPIVAKMEGGEYPKTYLNAGAIIHPDTLKEEAAKYNMDYMLDYFVHPHAARIRDEDIESENSADGLVNKIASTGKGTGTALANKILRKPGSVMNPEQRTDAGCELNNIVDNLHSKIFLETAQGFSLGINSGFYPTCTSRECTVAQALADARISPKRLQHVAMVIRTYPIRVGNTENSSGGTYLDQEELRWEDIEQEPEYTTVTKRMRRVFSFSFMQLHDAMVVNQPDVLYVNFMNYIKESERQRFIDRVKDTCVVAVGWVPIIIAGYGPKVEDMRLVK